MPQSAPVSPTAQLRLLASLSSTANPSASRPITPDQVMDIESSASDDLSPFKDGWESRREDSIKAHYKRHGLNPPGFSDDARPQHRTSRTKGAIKSPTKSTTPNLERRFQERINTKYSAEAPTSPSRSSRFERRQVGSPTTQYARRSRQLSPDLEIDRYSYPQIDAAEADLRGTKENEGHQNNHTTKSDMEMNEKLRLQLTQLSKELADQTSQSHSAAQKATEMERQIFELNSMLLMKKHRAIILENRIRENKAQTTNLAASNEMLKVGLLRFQVQLDRANESLREASAAGTGRRSSSASSKINTDFLTLSSRTYSSQLRNNVSRWDRDLYEL